MASYDPSTCSKSQGNVQDSTPERSLHHEGGLCSTQSSNDDRLQDTTGDVGETNSSAPDIEHDPGTNAGGSASISSPEAIGVRLGSTDADTTLDANIASNHPTNRSEWLAAAKPKCPACGVKHPPPCDPVLSVVTRANAALGPKLRKRKRDKFEAAPSTPKKPKKMEVCFRCRSKHDLSTCTARSCDECGIIHKAGDACPQDDEEIERAVATDFFQIMESQGGTLHVNARRVLIRHCELFRLPPAFVDQVRNW